MITLNQRLTSVCNYLVPGKLADIGSDHAYLPIYAIQNNLISSAIAGEVIKGPYEAAKKNVLVNQLNDVIDVRLGDGLSVISKSESIQNITICGMGGPLIAKILKEGKEHLVQGPRLVLQSNIQTEALRYTLMSINYHIVDEIIMEEKGHIYEIVVAEYNTNSENLNNKELKFGPKLLQKKNEIFYKKWNHELEALKHIRNQLNSESHHERLKEIENDISLITEVLNYED
ncbi:MULTISPECIES: tRNA (adenine(22)-N(1))-methyltransferase TrmK [Staphylococcus]|nr:MULTISPECIES: tRNA (adenine(22)-N(1))-methyltransferase TrmK [Staphylococcus]MCH4392031.1 tRNA (adenine(22)-N(1))-methyltransferase TrmK [Staphylococcus haemolyticus]MCI2950613.1 tRNA (adenine(22)-N(1))-methyltransferase TrmK [Staphylococcus haemolyticus]OFP28881.1 tRNA methyltransferase [Staphylococcus sp. HMSC068H08]OFS52502.1 tRNA methyltransferase [Staphylococcus sp. HMSC065C09]OHP65861.1 tRNA methyltransferase [Staphylococcus sp. HMSC062A01]